MNCDNCGKEVKPPFDDYCEDCCRDDYFIVIYNSKTGGYEKQSPTNKQIKGA